jgi:hypothetical protein
MVVATFALAACGDSSTGIRPGALTGPASARPTFDYSGGHGVGTEGTEFTVGADGGSFSVNGAFSVNFPANSVCDPAVSDYAAWGTNCPTLKDNITIQAQLRVTSSGLTVDFTPQLRFSPLAGPVTISTDLFAKVLTANASYFATNPDALEFLAINYVPTITATPVADFATNPALITHVDLSSGRVWRVVQHFSGYLIGAGTQCDPTTPPGCVEVDGTP